MGRTSVSQGKSAQNMTSKRGTVASKRSAQTPPQAIARRPSAQVLTSLMSTKGLPRDVHVMILALAKQSSGVAKGKEPQADREVRMATLSDLICDIDGNLFAALQNARDNLKRLRATRQSHVAAEAKALSQLAEQKKAVEDARAGLEGAAEAIEKRNTDFKRAHIGKKKCEAELAALHGKSKRLEATERDVYMPLKKKSAGGCEGQKQLKRLCQVGKTYGFHKVLMSTLPAVLRKQPDRRQTFDDIAMDRLEVEFARHAADSEAAVESGRRALEGHVAVARAAQASLVVAEEERKERAKALAEAEDALAASKAAIAAVRLRKRASATELRRADGEVARAEALLNSFRKGPLTALGTFWQSTDDGADASLPGNANGPTASHAETVEEEGQAEQLFSGDPEEVKKDGESATAVAEHVNAAGLGMAAQALDQRLEVRGTKEMRAHDSMMSLPDDAFVEFRSFAAAAMTSPASKSKPEMAD